MPIFDYRCEACGHSFDVLQKVGEGALRKCPECGKAKLKKLLAAPAFHLKGSGWYKTDFRDQSAKQTKDEKAKDEKSGSKPADKAGEKDAAGTGPAKDKGHSLDTSTPHSHDGAHGKDGHSHGGHTHTHGGTTHSHGPGGHKH